MPNRRTTRRLLLVGTLLVGSPLGCGRSQAPSWPLENQIVVALDSAPIHLDPRVGSDQASARTFELAFSGLVTKSPEGELIPDLATSWEILEDGRRYRFHLRPGVRFHDGRPFGADDVVWTYTSIVDGSVSTPKRGAFEPVAEIVRVDESTVDFVMSEPHGAMLSNFTSFVGVVPRGATPEAMNREPVGTGPFRLVERTPDRFTFDAFDGHYAGRPKLDRIVLREVPDATVRALELRKGSVQLVVNGLTPDTIPKFRDHTSYQVIESPGANYTYIGVNLEDEILRRQEVRRAIAHALDRELIVDALWRGLGIVTETMMPPGHWSRHDDLVPIDYDPATARDLLDAAGFPDPAGPEPRFRLTYKTSTDATRVLLAQVVQSMLAEVGIEVEIRSYEFATFYSDIKRGNFQLFSLTWFGIVDPDMLHLVLHSDNIPPAGANRGRYRNSEFDDLTVEGARATLNEDRRPYYLRAQEIFARELPYISLFTTLNVAIAPRELSGYRNYPSGELYGLREAWWDRTEAL